ncbi:TrkH family potassium uptake protein [Erysipelotrichaceae bacterium HCN-30851]
MSNLIHSVLGFKKMSPAQKIALSFLFVILVGAFLLTMPFSNKNGQFLNPIDALFMATSATCVTGLGVVTVADQFNLFGQIVMMLLIQVGGLGLMTFMAIFVLLLKNRLSINEKIAMKEMLNQDRVINMRKFLLDILRYTLFFEAIGAILVSIRMIPQYGITDGIFKSIFLAVSAFCNAGFDTLGGISLQEYVHDPLICLTIMSLIVLGGLGFAVWFDIRDKVRQVFQGNLTWKKLRHSLSFHTKIVLSVTAFLIVVPGLMIMALEYNNPSTMQDFNIFEKLMSAMFESIALRTAGFTSINYAGLEPATALLMMVVMFIGGSPGGTAGGIKTTTMAVLVVYLISSLKGREHTVVLRRNIRENIVIHAMGVFFVNLFVLITGIFLLNITEQQTFLSLCFEAVSALATVGSSLGITSSLTVWGELIIIFLMYVGRIGISTFIISLIRNRPNRSSANKVSYPNGNIIVG